MTYSEYELRLPATAGGAEVLALLDQVRSHALALQFSDVTPMWQLSGRELSVDLEAWVRRPLPPV